MFQNRQQIKKSWQYFHLIRNQKQIPYHPILYCEPVGTKFELFGGRFEVVSLYFSGIVCNWNCNKLLFIKVL